MSLLCWNCRGVGNPWSVHRLSRWSIDVSPDLMFLSETKISKDVVEGLKGRIGFSNAFGVSSRGKSGAICLFLKNDMVDFQLIFFSQNHICENVTKGGEKWRLVGMYG